MDIQTRVNINRVIVDDIQPVIEIVFENCKNSVLIDLNSAERLYQHLGIVLSHGQLQIHSCADARSTL